MNRLEILLNSATKTSLTNTPTQISTKTVDLVEEVCSKVQKTNLVLATNKYLVALILSLKF